MEKEPYMSKKPYLYRKRALFVWQKSPTSTCIENQTPFQAKQTAICMANEPLFHGKETYLQGKRDLRGVPQRGRNSRISLALPGFAGFAGFAGFEGVQC